MKVSVYVLITMLISVESALAAAKGANHVPSIKDLIYPAINFILLFSFLVWKLKKPLSESFTKKADEIKTFMASAAQKSKDAEEKLVDLQKKMKQLDGECSQIKKEYEADVVQFTSLQSTETQTNIARIKRDLEGKLEGETKELMNELNKELLESVIAQAQSSIKSNSGLKGQATSKIVSQLQ